MKFGVGLLIGYLLLETKRRSLYEIIVEEISDGEVEVMNNFFHESKPPNQLDLTEFTLLIAIRIGAVPIDIIQMIKERFQMLDRKHLNRISYADVASTYHQIVRLMLPILSSYVKRIIYFFPAQLRGQKARVSWCLV